MSVKDSIARKKQLFLLILSVVVLGVLVNIVSESIFTFVDPGPFSLSASLVLIALVVFLIYRRFRPKSVSETFYYSLVLYENRGNPLGLLSPRRIEFNVFHHLQELLKDNTVQSIFEQHEPDTKYPYLLDIMELVILQHYARSHCFHWLLDRVTTGLRMQERSYKSASGRRIKINDITYLRENSAFKARLIHPTEFTIPDNMKIGFGRTEKSRVLSLKGLVNFSVTLRQSQWSVGNQLYVPENLSAASIQERYQTFVFSITSEIKTNFWSFLNQRSINQQQWAEDFSNQLEQDMADSHYYS